MKRKKFKVFYEVVETGEFKTIEIIARDKYEVRNIFNDTFNKGILKEVKVEKINESVII